MADTGVIDAARQEEFVEVVEQISGTMTTLLAAIGDRLGLFKNLAEQGPATSAELASRTKLNERYLREWLGGMATAGYLNYDAPKTLYPAGRTRGGASAGERPIFCRRHISDAASASRSIRRGFKRVSHWRRRFSITIQRHDVGWPGTVHLRMVREFDVATMDPRHAGR